MAEVFSNSPCMLGKRVLSPHPHSLMGGQLDFSSKKRRLGLGADQGMFERSEAEENHRSLSPVRAGKRARPLSPLQPLASSTSSSLSHLPHSSSAEGGRGGRLGDASFGFSHHQHPHARQQQAAERERAEGVEVVALRREVVALRAHVVEKEGGLGLARDENARLKDGLGMYQKEVERLSSENRILKRAVGIQNSKGKEVESQLHDLQQAAGQAAEYIKRLEQTNYALSVRVQAMGNPGPSDFMGGQRPPDVF